MTMEIETARPLNPDPEVLDVEWWIGLWSWTAPTIKELAGSDNPRDVMEALKTAKKAELEICQDLAKGQKSYVARLYAERFAEVMDALKTAKQAAEKMRDDPRWKLYEAVFGEEAGK